MEIGISLNSTNETVLVQREGGTKCEIVSLGRPFLSSFLFFSFRSSSPPLLRIFPSTSFQRGGRTLFLELRTRLLASRGLNEYEMPLLMECKYVEADTCAGRWYWVLLKNFFFPSLFARILWTDVFSLFGFSRFARKLKFRPALRSSCEKWGLKLFKSRHLFYVKFALPFFLWKINNNQSNNDTSSSSTSWWKLLLFRWIT